LRSVFLALKPYLFIVSLFLLPEHEFMSADHIFPSDPQCLIHPYTSKKNHVEGKLQPKEALTFDQCET